MNDLVRAGVQFVRPAPANEPRCFLIVRKTDVTGVSGVGVIGDGYQSSDGAVAYRWHGGPPQNQPKWEFYDNRGTDPFLQISGHDGRTELIWIDSLPTREPGATRPWQRSLTPVDRPRHPQQ
jgi:hypothetical protein